MKNELCIVCDEETGRSGAGDDSIFGTLLIDLPLFMNLTKNDEIGPLCEQCYECLCVTGIISNE